MNQGGKIGRVRVQPAILKYLAQYPGEEIWIDDLVNSTPFDEKQIQSAIMRLVANGYDIRVVMRGKSWSYHGLQRGQKPGTTAPKTQALSVVPTPVSNLPEIQKAPRTMYEEIGLTSDGTILVQSETGVIYRLGNIV